MLKFTNKRDVDRHVSQMTKNLSENERSGRGYAIAKTYAKVSEYEMARDWLQRYLDIKTEDAGAHKYMGELYECLSKPEQAITSYQRSYNLNSKQNDVIKSICRLFLINDGWTSSPAKAKYWCELADTENIRDDNVLSLRLKMLNKDMKGGGKPVEEMILKEIAARPHDVGLRIRIVKFLLDEKRVKEAFKYCFDLEMKFMEIFLLSVDWYTTVSSVIAQHTSTDNWNYWCLLLISIDKRIFLSLKKDLSLQTIKQHNIREVTNMLFEFDQVLKKAADSLLVLAPVKELGEEFINHFRGQLALHIASLLFQKQKVASNDQWRDTTKKCLPFLLFAFQCSTVNTEAFWLKNTNDTIRNLFSHLKKEGAFRCAQAGRTILACKSTGSDDITISIRNYKSWTSIEDIFNQVRETCVDLNWRKNMYRQLFANADQQTQASTSYLVQNSYFQEPIYEIISFNDVDSYEATAQYLYPSSLEHHVYLGLGRKDLHSYKSHTFAGLNLSTSNLINCNPETINRIDVDSFLYCAIIQAKRRLEAEKDCYESFSNKPNEKPLILPAANMVEGLCSEEQNEWWLSAFKIYKNITGENLAQLKATLQFGIEAVRGIDAPKIDVIILLKLGDTLLARANNGEKMEERRHFELRVEYVYKIAMRMLKSRESENMRRIFKFVTSNFDVDREVDQLVGTAIGHLSGIYFKREEFKEFIDDFAGLLNPWAHFFRAEAYKKLDESSKTPKKSKLLYAEKARENLIETLALLDRNENIDKNNPLRIRVEKDLKKMQYNLSTSFNEELSFHNNSQNGHGDEDFFHNASSTSFRGRRDISIPTPNYNDKFMEVESLIRKLSDLVVSVKDDVLSVRNDITDLKDELLNVRGDITDINVNKDSTTSKAMNDVYKAIEDLTWNVTYMMNLIPNPATAAMAPGQAGRFPQNQMQAAQLTQMFNTAFPMYNMQYPTPPMMQQQQRQPQAIPGQMTPAQLSYEALGQNLMMQQHSGMMSMQPGTQQKSSLLDALNTPSLLNTWNNTYNQPGPITPPNPLVQPMPQMTTPVVQIAPIQNKPVEKVPPVNVVITSSDPLPAQNSFVSQPTMSVTIPPQHIKHAPPPIFSQQPIVSSSVIRTPQYENISPVKNDTSEYLEEPADYDPRPDFKPIIPLPDEVEVKTGEENEDVMFSERCKLFRYSENEWKERGIGNIKILKNKDTGKYRILMRREQIHKLCANHTITSEMELKATAKENQLIWGANDYSEEQVTMEKFLVRFKQNEQANKFKDCFEEAKGMTPKIPSQESKQPLKTKDENVKVKPVAPIFGTPIASTFSFGGLTGALTTPTSGLFGSTPEKSKDKEADKTKPAQPSPFANFSFGQGSANKSFSELFGNISSPSKSDTPTTVLQVYPVDLTLNKSSHGEDDVEHYEPTATFEPVIPLPALVDMKTGEEDETVTFVHRAKLMRFDATTKEWKERGIGEIKVLVHKTDPSKARLLMRREQILKLCCNMFISKDLKFKKLNSTTYSFGGQDFSEAEMKTETLAIKFKSTELVGKFLDAVAEAQKNMSIVKEPVQKAPEKKVESKGFGDQFKPKVGSWTCEGCYISNKADVLYCVACDSPKDSTVPKKEAKSVLEPSADAPKFSFGMPAASGFSFGMPPPPPAPIISQPAGGGFVFGSQAATTSAPTTTTTSSFSFSSIAPTTEKSHEADSTTSGFAFGSAKTFSFGKESTLPAPVVVAPVTEEKPGFNFVFKKKSPSKTRSPGKSRNDSVNSEGGDEEEENYEEEENATYFTPAIALPDKVEVKTGEEDEEVLYSHRCKLYRFVDKEWKERGIGDIKILKHKETGKLRVVMRREQILKICLNFFLTDEVELKRKEENSWSFATIDFSEGEIEPTSFAIRFKNKEIADGFKKAMDDALAGASSSEKQDGETDEKSQLAKKLLLPEGFFDYLKAPNCSGCIGCNSDDYKYVSRANLEVSGEAKQIAMDSPMIEQRVKPRRQSVDKHVSFKLADEKDTSEEEKLKQLFGTGNVSEKANLFGGIKKSEGSTNIFAAFNSENPAPPSNVFGSTPGGIFGTKKDFATPTNSIFSSSLNTTPTVTSTEAGSKQTESFGSVVFGTKTNFAFSSGENMFSGANKENGETAAKPLAAFSTTPVFGSSMFGNNNAKTDTTQAAPMPNIFGSSTTSTFSFAEAAKDLDRNKDPNQPAVVPDFLTKTNESGGFAAIAASATPEQTWATSQSAGGFFGLTVKDDFFSKNLNKQGVHDSSNNDDSTANEESYDPHYDPIIALPDEINVSTGEEEEEKLFGERAKLFRYDAKTREWKERGVGEMKILHHVSNGTYRLLLRREQIFKLVLNQLITTEFHMSPMNNSQKAFCWTGMNFTEGANEAEQLAIRFKNEDLASAFKRKIDECLVKLESCDNLQPEND